jgi:hypothetical protein
MATDSSDKSGRAESSGRTAGISARALIVGAMVLLIVGVIGGGWAMTRLLAKNTPAAETLTTTSANSDAVATSANPDKTTDANMPGQALVVAPVDGANALAVRVAELEQRLSRITLEAESVSGNASRAEGLLVAFAVRRALDRGLSLGYLDAQLRLRFGDDQPNAVKTIIETARDPITLEQLRAKLDELAPQLVGRTENGGSLWTGIRRELSELFVVRPAGTLSTRASERLDRARRYLSGEQVDKAIEEVEALPGKDAAEDWLIDARRYHEARRALDLIETAAILEPRDAPNAALSAKKANNPS